MATYKFVSKDIHAKKVRGTLEAENYQELVTKLKEKDLYLISYRDVSQDAKNVYKLKYKELAVFSREVGTMLSSGLSLIRTFAIMCRRENNRKIKTIYNDIYVKLQQGYTLSAAMEAQNGAFPDLMIAMYRSGEASGSMDKTAMTMASQYDKDYKVRGKTKSAMMYPLILVVVTVVVLMIVYLAVLPSFFDIFENVELPWITKINIGISKFLQSYWYLVIFAGIGFGAIFATLLQVESVRYKIDRFKVHAFKFGPLMKTIYTSRFARTVCSLYSSGMSIVSALSIVKSTIGNTYIESQFDHVLKRIKNGDTLSQSISDVDGFDVKLISSIYVGEESGRLDTMLTTLADDFDYDAQQASERMVTLLQPIMIVILAVIICIIVISVLLPIYTLYNNVGSM